MGEPVFRKRWHDSFSRHHREFFLAMFRKCSCLSVKPTNRCSNSMTGIRQKWDTPRVDVAAVLGLSVRCQNASFPGLVGFACSLILETKAVSNHTPTRRNARLFVCFVGNRELIWSSPRELPALNACILVSFILSAHTVVITKTLFPYT